MVAVMKDKQENSNIKLSSNIMIHAKYERDPWAYIPTDLLPSYCSDARVSKFLSPGQRKQLEKKLYYAKNVIDEE